MYLYLLLIMISSASFSAAKLIIAAPTMIPTRASPSGFAYTGSRQTTRSKAPRRREQHDAEACLRSASGSCANPCSYRGMAQILQISSPIHAPAPSQTTLRLCGCISSCCESPAYSAPQRKRWCTYRNGRHCTQPPGSSLHPTGISSITCSSVVVSVLPVSSQILRHARRSRHKYA